MCKIRVGFINIEGFKKALANREINNLLNETDILGIAESWLCDSDMITIKGYATFFKNKIKRNKFGRNPGGIGFLINDSLSKYIKIIECNQEESLWLEFKDTENSIFIIFVVIYQPPCSSKYFNEKLYDQLEEELNKISNKFTNYEICIMGDFNARTGKLDTENIGLVDYSNFDGLNYEKIPRKSRDPIVNRQGEKLIDFCVSNNLVLINGNFSGDPEGDFT